MLHNSMSTFRKGLVWFKNDLRLHDNITLNRAIAECDTVICVYVLDNISLSTGCFGFSKSGPHRNQFLYEALLDLEQGLKSKGNCLIFKTGSTVAELSHLCNNYNITDLYFTAEHAPEEEKIIVQVCEQHTLMGIKCHAIEQQCMLDTSLLGYAVSNVPVQFTVFREKAEKKGLPMLPIVQEPDHITQEPMMVEGIKSIAAFLQNNVVTDKRSAYPFSGGESNAKAHIQAYFWEKKLASTYYETRNQLTGTEYSSKFSAWLALGCVSARTIYQEIKSFERTFGANKSTYWLVFELLWRDFFRLTMQRYGSRMFKINGIKPGVPVEWENNLTALTQWINGQTKEPLINALMLELKHTGYMSNRGRQITASYLVNDLKVNWLMGAAYFESVLIDYDVYSNYGNWAYAAGVGNDPRGLRYFNVPKQEVQFDPDGTYIGLWKS